MRIYAGFVTVNAFYRNNSKVVVGMATAFTCH